jgi:glycosyltransferase involved in cell wall biosynthesis
MPDLGGGGAERVAVNMANCFIQRGYKVDMVLLSARGAFLDELQSDVDVRDLKVNRLRRALMPLVHYLRTAQPQALLANMWPLTSIAILARMIAGVATRIVVVEHTTWSKDAIAHNKIGRWKVATSMSLTFPSADGIVAVSQGAADDLARFANLDRDKISPIYNPVVGGETRPVDTTMVPMSWWSGAHFKLLAVGNLSPIKDYTTLLNAFARLRQNVNARLLILGEGDCRQSLEAQARQLGIEGSLFMPGFLKDPTPYYHRADLHVLSSKGEGFGNVLVEALAAGTPVVSTDCLSGPREILLDGTFGRLVPVGDASAMAGAMAESLASRHDFVALRARAQDFSIETAVDLYERLLFPVCDIS